MRDTVEKLLRGAEPGALKALFLSIALMALVSLNPYLMWGYQKVWYGAVSCLLVLSFAGCSRLLQPTRTQLGLGAGVVLFLAYLSLLPKVDGPPTRWFFLIPFAAACFVIGTDQLKKAFGLFHWLFALSLVPGMLVWLWLVAGLPLEMEHFSLPRHIAKKEMADYVGVFGAIFLPYDAMTLPNGGMLFRLCAIYDEPGTVGTVAALCLAATRFRIADARGAICLAAGIMSISLAFAILAIVGFIATMLVEKRLKVVLAVIAGITVVALALSGVTFQLVPPPTPGLTTPDKDAASPGQDHSVGLRWFTFRDNRATPEMRALFQRYADSSPGTILFGIASNASIVYGHEGAVWYSTLTDYGLTGFVWLFLLYSYPVFLLWRAGRLNAPIVVFCTLYLLSFYQRPIIWLPAQILIYFAGIYCMPGLSHKQEPASTSAR